MDIISKKRIDYYINNFINKDDISHLEIKYTKTAKTFKRPIIKKERDYIHNLNTNVEKPHFLIEYTKLLIHLKDQSSKKELTLLIIQIQNKTLKNQFRKI